MLIADYFDPDNTATTLGAIVAETTRADLSDSQWVAYLRDAGTDPPRRTAQGRYPGTDRFMSGESLSPKANGSDPWG
jgi:hypothetical protein